MRGATGNAMVWRRLGFAPRFASGMAPLLRFQPAAGVALEPGVGSAPGVGPRSRMGRRPGMGREPRMGRERRMGPAPGMGLEQRVVVIPKAGPNRRSLTLSPIR